MAFFHCFFAVIMVVSITRVSINVMIFKASVKDATGLTFLTYESYAIITELASCLVLLFYYRTVTQKNFKQAAKRLS